MTLDVVDNQAESRYELRSNGDLFGMIVYRPEAGGLALVHTEIEPQLQGRGLGTKLVAGALADLRERGLRVIPRCPFVAAYLHQHPEPQSPGD